MADAQTVTLLLRQLRDGGQQTLNDLIPMVYQELHRIADSYLLRERSNHTLQPTALVHEAYLRLVDQDQPDYRSRTHFYGVAAHLMRQILVDHARKRQCAKRGGDLLRFSLDEASDVPAGWENQLTELDDALHDLEKLDAQKASLIELRYFAGLTAEESAEFLGISPHIVRHQLRFAQAWLQRQLNLKPTS